MDSDLREALITHAADEAVRHWWSVDCTPHAEYVRGCACGWTGTLGHKELDEWNLHVESRVLDALLAYTIPCPTCEGSGTKPWGVNMVTDKPSEVLYGPCPACSGSGRVPALTETQ